MIAILLILGFSIFLLFLTGIINIATDPMSIDQEEERKERHKARYAASTYQ
ncbi:MAG TPA: hypothetical protein VHD55_01605 [Candidatus Paceibacterota bacterium]|nr:hypothetical protein [Candidatus Paceibacterota bacterium]